MKIKELRIVRPNNRPDIVIYPLSYWDAVKTAQYFEREYKNSEVKIVSIHNRPISFRGRIH